MTKPASFFTGTCNIWKVNFERFVYIKSMCQVRVLLLSDSSSCTCCAPPLLTEYTASPSTYRVPLVNSTDLPGCSFTIWSRILNAFVYFSLSPRVRMVLRRMCARWEICRSLYAFRFTASRCCGFVKWRRRNFGRFSALWSGFPILLWYITWYK